MLCRSSNSSAECAVADDKESSRTSIGPHNPFVQGTGVCGSGLPVRGFDQNSTARQRNATALRTTAQYSTAKLQTTGHLFILRRQRKTQSRPYTSHYTYDLRTNTTSLILFLDDNQPAGDDSPITTLTTIPQKEPWPAAVVPPAQGP